MQQVFFLPGNSQAHNRKVIFFVILQYLSSIGLTTGLYKKYIFNEKFADFISYSFVKD